MTETLHSQLERSAALHPDRLAITSGNEEMTYSELETAANRIATLLKSNGIGPGDRVSLFLDKSLDAVAGLYGTMKSGAAYVPLDPAAPAARIAHIIENCEVDTIISSSKKAQAWPEIIAAGAQLTRIVVPDAEHIATKDLPSQVRLFAGAAVAAHPGDRLDVAVPDTDLALILYTSGSTGDPKGVMLSHRNVLAFASWAATEFAFTADDRLSQLAPLHFDLSTLDLFSTARVGASVHLVSRQTTMFPMQIRRFLEAKEISVTYAVPSILTMMTERTQLETGDLPDLRTILFAGEVFPTKYLSRLMRLLPHTEFANLFGPTETNVCTFYRVPQAPPEDGPPVLIGKGIAGVETSVVDDAGSVVPKGEPGELWVRGPTVMQGYWPARREGTDAEPDLYRTGDLVRETSSGDYEFIGRRDSQIKSRGYRIELGDIEAAMLAHPDILECAVIAVPDDLVTNRLSACVVKTEALSEEEIVSFLSNRLPKYMIPDKFEYSDILPKTSTGKINRQALAAALTQTE